VQYLLQIKTSLSI